ncbi:iron ABC transporter permease [Flaviaesturariibacter flavus]|uniref:Iron ABC transporter permease n=1 Tax=Flaviaesturariibacter flavus TaxID=2502780 RepID=A0A4R1BNP5_9BACT|nr:iron ABC transporter permease [Flaviaesturariibacter flavus]TCJ19250.1 iron ABC transporter permease [Flaviaesturariibacter flavus]
MLWAWSYKKIYAALSLLLLVLFFVSVGVGAVPIAFGEIPGLLRHHWGGPGEVNGLHEALFFSIRLPRSLLCILVGAALSVSGALMQSLFRNPIVEPGLVGTSAGSALGAALLIVLGQNAFFGRFAFLGSLLAPACAFIGGMVATLLVYYFASAVNRVNISVMILAGIAVNALANGGTGFLAYIARDPQARSITFWSLGTLSVASWKMVGIVCISTVSGILLALRLASPLNVLQLGDAEARYLGVRTERLKISVLLVNALLVAVATSMVGVISFVGLIVPHLLRLLKGSDNRHLVAGSALLGASVLLATDMVCRVVIAPAEMPIGIVTAFIGAPLFLYLLHRIRRSGQKGGFYA